MSEESATAAATPPRQDCFMMHADYVQHQFSWCDTEQLFFLSLQRLELVCRLHICNSQCGLTSHVGPLLQCLEASQQPESKQQWQSDPQVEQAHLTPGQSIVCQHPKISSQDSSEHSNHQSCCHGLLYVCTNSTRHQHALLACCVHLQHHFALACSAAVTSVS